MIDWLIALAAGLAEGGAFGGGSGGTSPPPTFNLNPTPLPNLGTPAPVGLPLLPPPMGGSLLNPQAPTPVPIITPQGGPPPAPISVAPLPGNPAVRVVTTPAPPVVGPTAGVSTFAVLPSSGPVVPAPVVINPSNNAVIPGGVGPAAPPARLVF